MAPVKRLGSQTYVALTFSNFGTVDGRNPANQLRLVVYPIIYKVLYIPGGCLGFFPPTVSSSKYTEHESPDIT